MGPLVGLFQVLRELAFHNTDREIVTKTLDRSGLEEDACWRFRSGLTSALNAG
jgi:hypothetical protein